MSCDHLDRSGLERVLVGDDPHVTGCGDCQAVLGGYRRLEAALTATSADARPRAGWERRVLAAAEAREEPRRPWWLLVAPLAAAAAAVALWFAWPRGDGAPRAPMLAVTVLKSGTVVRGDDAHVGDTLRIAARGGGPRRVLWVFRGDRLVLACPGAATCTVSGDTVAGDVVVSEPGTFQVIYASDLAHELEPTGSLDADLAQLTRAGGVQRKTSLEAR